MKSNRYSVSGLALLFLLASFSLGGCAAPKEVGLIKDSPMPPGYIYQEREEEAARANEGSLWASKSSLFEDEKARALNDIITVLVTEQNSASQKASTDTERDSSSKYEVSDLFGAPLDLGLRYSNGNPFVPKAGGSSDSQHSGKGVTTREGKLVAKISAKVVQVFPNGNMRIKGRKEILVNNEKDILVLQGIVRPKDVLSDNTVLSDKLADAQIFLVGKGDIDDKQGTGWLVRILDKVWPF